MSDKNFNWTVHCFDDKSLRKHFEQKGQAVTYANDLLSQGHKAKLFTYSQPKRYIDHIAENEELYR